MPRRRPPAGRRVSISVSNALLLLFLSLPLLAVAQQQQSRAPNAHAANAHSRNSHIAKQQLINSVDTPRNGKDTFIIPSDERALATLAPADAAVRAPPARSSATSAALSSRHPARSLQDWQVEDLILLATVDGKIHARHRRTGAPKWTLEADRPMVETTYHRNTSLDAAAPEENDILWIVEPTQDGSLYVYSPALNSGVQKTGLSVKQLVEELSPYASEDPPVVYTADKKNTLLTIDANTGHILKSFSPAGTVTNDDRSCRRVNPMESLDEEECESIGTLTLGRTEYTVAIQDKATGHPICTIRYFEWTANNRDRDLHDQYAKTMDNKYVYAQHNGGVFAVDHGMSDGVDAPITFKHKFNAPVARVFDVVRPSDLDTSVDAALVLLPQPLGPAGGDIFSEDKVFVNCTETGSWYAMSEKMYPTVTDGASNAVCYTDSLSDEAFMYPLTLSRQRAKLVGIHPLSPITEQQQSMFTIGSSQDYPTIGANDGGNDTQLDLYQKRAWSDNLLMALVSILAVFGLVALVGQVPMARKTLMPWLQSLNKTSLAMPQKLEVQEALSEPDHVQPPTTVKPAVTKQVRFPEPAEETVFAKDDESDSDKAPSEEQTTDVIPKAAAISSAVEAGALQNDEAPAKPKKKATRGVRGGRKTKEKRQEQLEKQLKSRPDASGEKEEASTAVDQTLVKAGTMPPVNIISPEASESPTISGKLQINNLLIDMDKDIGHGSAGTCVFAGSFEVHHYSTRQVVSQFANIIVRRDKTSQ